MQEYELEQNMLYKLIKELKLKGIKFIFLDGKVGSGKTTFIKEMALYLGIKSEVTSPTFSFVNEYEDRLFHYDMYNINLDKFINIGLLDNLDKDGVHIFEWGSDTFKDMIKGFGFDILCIKIETLKDENKRFYKVIYG